MALIAGDKLGPYEVVAPLGAGGMGEVYKARDTRLDRTVAIKVLPEHIAKREDLRARFEREARAVASLNHPNICTLYDIGNQDGVGGFMVMELIDGESLAERIEKGAIPLDQALQFATQIADALDRAHRAGVTHRDVKPQNIMLTRDGVKVLDFGLAKSQAKPGPTEETLTAVLTTEGTIMGTPQYMAPEQFAGKEADARSDIWAFGAVLYEMVTGRKAFHGSNYQSLVGAILAMDPAPMAVQPFTPAWLERLVRRCLAKDPENRCQTMREVVIDLKSPPAEVSPAAATSNRWPWAVAGALALALLGSGVLLYNATRPAPLQPLIRLNAEIAADTQPLQPGQRGNIMAISPDGTRLALALPAADGKSRLYTRLLHQNQATPLPATEGAQNPFFSPDSDWIGFFADGKLKKISVAGGAAVTLCDAPTPHGASWGDDGNIIAVLDAGTGLSRVPSSGGAPVPITKPNPGENLHSSPQILGGSQAVLFNVSLTKTNINPNLGNAHIEAVSLQTGERKTIHGAGFSPSYVPAASGPGHLVYLQKGTLFAAPFDPVRLSVTGSPVPILEDVDSSTGGGRAFAISRNGTFVYLPGKGTDPMYPISSVESSGKTQPPYAPPGRHSFPRFSPDGKRLAFVSNSGDGSNIWVKDLDRDTTSRLSFLPNDNTHPVWTPDGKFIVFRSENPAAPGLFGIRTDGSGEAKRLDDSKLIRYPESFSPDGKHLAVTQRRIDGGADIFTLSVEADSGPGAAGVRLGSAEPFQSTPFSEIVARFSPDGRWLAYSSNASGGTEVYVRPFPGPGGRWQISSGGGTRPNWSRDGRELLYQTPAGRVMAVGYTANGDAFAAGKPRMWAEVRLRDLIRYDNYELAPDGKRLAAILAAETSAEKPLTHLTFLLHFADELQRRAPARK